MPRRISIPTVYAIVVAATALTAVRWALPGDNELLSIATLALLAAIVVGGRDSLRPRFGRRAASR